MTIPVFYSISDDFTKYAAVSLNSLVKNSNQIGRASCRERV